MHTDSQPNSLRSRSLEKHPSGQERGDLGDPDSELDGAESS